MIGFRARLIPVPHGGYFVVVSDATAVMAGVKFRDRVRGTVEGIAYRSSLARYSGELHVGVPSAVLAEVGATGGDTVEMTIEIDPDPLPGDVLPEDLAAAMDESAQARAGFEAMGPAHRREHVKHVLEAKRPETRRRRITSTIEALATHAEKKKKKPATKKKSAKKTKKKKKR